MRECLQHVQTFKELCTLEHPQPIGARRWHANLPPSKGPGEGVHASALFCSQLRFFFSLDLYVRYAICKRDLL